MAIDRVEGFEDGFLDLVAEQLKRCHHELGDLDREISRLQDQRTDAAKRVSQLEDILSGSDSGQNSIPDDAEAQPSSSARRPRSIADADAVVDLIREHGEPMHYLEIHKMLVDRGFEIGGEGKADTLLSRYFKDPRLSRVSRGTYDLADQSNSETKPDAKRNPPLSPLALPKVPSPPTQRLNSRMTMAEMAVETLRQVGKPLHYGKITERIRTSGFLRTKGRTPEASMNTVMSVDIQRNGDHSVFIRTGRGIYGLREWEK